MPVSAWRCVQQTIDTKYDALNELVVDVKGREHNSLEVALQAGIREASHQDQSLLAGYQSSLSLDTQVVTCAAITGGFKQGTNMVKELITLHSRPGD